MRVHYLEHVPFERVAAIEDWVRARGHTASGTHLHRSADFPAPADLDLLVIMGGPMNVYEYEAYPWLAPEKSFIREVIASGKAVIGICLGAQLIADVLGGPASKNPHPEIGWFPVTLTEEGRQEPVFADFPPEFTTMHWHGDTFAVPPGATWVASSAACANQAFAYDGGRVVGLQFHLEATPALLESLLLNAGHELDRLKDERWVQSRESLAEPGGPYEACQALLFALLDRMVATVAR